MPLPLVPIAIGAVVSAAAWKKFKKPPAMTDARKKIFEQAMKTLNDPAKLKTLATEFEKEGLKFQGSELRKRAAIFAAPPEVKAQRKAVFKKAMDSNNPTAIKKVAAAFHKVGHYESAAKLRDYARGLFKSMPQNKVKMTAGVHGDFDDVGCNDATTPEV
jgi:hypothetical protein